MILRWRYDLPGAQRVERDLHHTGEQIADWRPVLKKIGEDFLGYEESVFASEGAASASGAWAPLTKRYRRWKEKHYPGKTILVRSGTLRRALTKRRAKGNIHRMTTKTLTVGAALRTPNGRWDLGEIHSMGRKDGSIPARPLLDPPESRFRKWTGMAREHLKQVTKG